MRLWWGLFTRSRKYMCLKLRSSFVSWQWKMMQNLKRTWLASSKLTWGIWRIFTPALKNLKNLHFNRLLLTKVCNVWAKKKYKRVMFNGTKYWCKIWKKIDLCFQKWHEEFKKFSPEHFLNSKNWDFDGILFIRSKKCTSLKFTDEFCIMTIKNDTKPEEELTCQFKTDVKNLTNFDPTTWKSKNFAL